MRKLLFLLLLGYASAHAAPPCWPLSPNSTNTNTGMTADGAYLIWFCDVGHKWDNGWIITGAFSEVPSASVIHDWLANKTDADRAIAFDAIPHPIAGSADARLFNYANALPKPTSVPPSGYVTLDTKTFKLALTPMGALTFALVGAVPLSTPCLNGTPIGQFYPVPHAAVTLTTSAVVDAHAPLYARCR